MLEDVLGWVVVLISSIVMRFTNLSIIDPIVSIVVALFIVISALKNLKEITELFLEKIPNEISITEIKNHLLEIDGVLDVHHIHVWRADEQNNRATMHIVTDADAYEIKNKVKGELKEHGILHTTLEIERPNESCSELNCSTYTKKTECHHIHHHKHH
jgi:cobalt-zinc-cadmium efflux system protein